MTHIFCFLGILIAYTVIGGRRAFNQAELVCAGFILIGSALITFFLHPKDAAPTWEQNATYLPAIFLASVLHTWHRIRLSAVALGASLALALTQEKSDLLFYYSQNAVFCAATCCLLVPTRPIGASARGRIFVGHLNNWIFGYFAVNTAYLLHHQGSADAGVLAIDQTLFGAAIVVAVVAILNIINDFPIPVRRSFARAMDISRANLASRYLETGPLSFKLFLSSSIAMCLLLLLVSGWESRIVAIALVVLSRFSDNSTSDPSVTSR